MVIPVDSYSDSPAAPPEGGKNLTPTLRVSPSP